MAHDCATTVPPGGERSYVRKRAGKCTVLPERVVLGRAVGELDEENELFVALSIEDGTGEEGYVVAEGQVGLPCGQESFEVLAAVGERTGVVCCRRSATGVWGAVVVVGGGDDDDAQGGPV